MNAGWERQKALFLAALEQQGDARRALLEGASATDREQVESLLAAHVATDSAPARAAGDTVMHSGLLEAITGTAARGRRLGTWQLEMSLGLGPLGHSFRAFDSSSRGGVGRSAVLEVVEGEGAFAELAAKLEPLARRLLALEHPGIARTLEVGREGTTLWVAHEEVGGMPIDKACDLERATIAVRAQRLAAAAEALEVLHQHGLLHRDLSTRTVRVLADGTVVLADVGLEGLLPAGLPRATSASTAPELTAGATAGPAADLWSLGTVAFALLAGVAPRVAEPRTRRAQHQVSSEQIRGARASEAVAAMPFEQRAAIAAARGLEPGELVGALEPFDELLAACLESDPGRRPGSAGVVAARLRALTGR